MIHRKEISINKKPIINANIGISAKIKNTKINIRGNLISLKELT